MNLSIALVGIGGFLGATLRYLLTMIFNSSPLAIFFVNLIGCFLIGVVSSVIDSYYPFNQAYRLIIITGFLGGFTTFSAFGLDSLNLLKESYYFEATFYIVIQVVMGISMVYLGEVLVRKFGLSI